MDREYFRIHAWITYNHGKAKLCENELCVSVKPKRYEWALLKGKDHEKNRNNYIQLCPSCHRKYDYTQEQRNKLSKSKKGLPAKNKKPVILNNHIVYESMSQASIMTGVSVSSIHNNIKGLSNKTKVGRWEYQEKN